MNAIFVLLLLSTPARSQTSVLNAPVPVAGPAVPGLALPAAGPAGGGLGLPPSALTPSLGASLPSLPTVQPVASSFWGDYVPLRRRLGVADPEGLQARVADPELGRRLEQVRASDKPLVADLSLEAYLPELEGHAQKALGAGDLGHRTGETWGAYARQKELHAFGVLPLYSSNGGPDGNVPVAWAFEPAVRPVLVRDDTGGSSILRLPVEFRGRSIEVQVYWLDRGGTPVFLLYCPEVFRTLYPGPGEQLRQAAYFGRAYVELFKRLGLPPDVARINEPALVFAANAMKNDVDWHNHARIKSVFDGTRFVMTTHTTDKAALPVWDAEWLKGEVGQDLVRDWEGAREMLVEGNGPRQASAALGLARMSDAVTAVSAEQAEVTKFLVLPDSKDKVVAIQSGADPEQWSSGELKARLRKPHPGELSGPELFEIGRRQKRVLDERLRLRYGSGFDDPDRPLVASVDRWVAYKEQDLLLPLAEWIVGDRDKTFATPWGPRSGLGANLLLGGEGWDGPGRAWLRGFRELARRPGLKGRLLVVEDSGIELARLSAAASDIWVEVPRPTREAAAAGGQAAAFNGKHVIATAAGAALAYVVDGLTGWLIDVFRGWPFRVVAQRFEREDHESLELFRSEGGRRLAASLQQALDAYRAYTDHGDPRWPDGMRRAFLEAHRKLDIDLMVREYMRLFRSLLEGSGVEGYLRWRAPGA